MLTLVFTNAILVVLQIPTIICLLNLNPPYFYRLNFLSLQAFQGSLESFQFFRKFPQITKAALLFSFPIILPAALLQIRGDIDQLRLAINALVDKLHGSFLTTEQISQIIPYLNQQSSLLLQPLHQLFSSKLDCLILPIGRTATAEPACPLVKEDEGEAGAGQH